MPLPGPCRTLLLAFPVCAGHALLPGLQPGTSLSRRPALTQGGGLEFADGRWMLPHPSRFDRIINL